MKTLLHRLLAAVVIVAVLPACNTVDSNAPVPERLVVEDGAFLKSGHKKADADNNGIPDAGVEVTGQKKPVYAYDASGAYYWDLDDGRVYTSPGVTSVDDLDDASLTVCQYVENYRGDFGNDPFLDSGWIQNHINCKGVDRGHYNYLIVHETDPRYTGNPDWAIWGTWEYKILAVSGEGNRVAHSVNPQTP